MSDKRIKTWPWQVECPGRTAWYDDGGFAFSDFLAAGTKENEWTATLASQGERIASRTTKNRAQIFGKQCMSEYLRMSKMAKMDVRVVSATETTKGPNKGLLTYLVEVKR